MPDDTTFDEDQPLEVECSHCQETMETEVTPDGQVSHYCSNADFDWQSGCPCDLCTGEAKES